MKSCDVCVHHGEETRSRKTSIKYFAIVTDMILFLKLTLTCSVAKFLQSEVFVLKLHDECKYANVAVNLLFFFRNKHLVWFYLRKMFEKCVF